MNLGKLWKMIRNKEPGMPQSLGSPRVRHDLTTEQHQQQLGFEREGKNRIGYLGDIANLSQKA